MKSNDSRRKSFEFAEAIYIAVIPIISYVVALCYELGYCSVFSIPTELIIPSKVTIFSVFCAFLVILLPIYCGVEVIYILFSEKIKKMDSSFIIKIFAVITIIYLIIFGSRGYMFKLLIWILLQIMFLIYVLPLFTQYKIKGYKNKLRQQDKIDSMVDTILDRGLKNDNYKYLIKSISILFAICMLSYGIGEYVALNKKDYLVIPGLEEKVILRIYGDTLITAQFDREKRIISEGFTLISTNSSVVYFEKDNVGPFIFK